MDLKSLILEIEKKNTEFPEIKTCADAFDYLVNSMP